MRALIADDHDLARKYLREILLEDCDFAEVDEAADGVEALGLLEARAYSAVILDIDMPRMGGLEVLARAAPSRPRCAFIVLSGHSEKAYAERALSLGASAFLAKGCPPARIAAAVWEALLARGRGGGGVTR